MNYGKKICDKKILIIFVVAFLSRIVLLGVYPVGVHADEAYAGYEAFSMLKYGMDSWGYVNPIYLTTWGSGMSVLESYLMIPFIAIGGLNTITVRMPQVIIGSISVVVFWLLIKKVKNDKMAFWALLFLALCPWHIMMSRWGLDANLAPGFILFAIYFGVLGLENKKYLIASAILWGMSLYCYALVWLFVPFFLLIAGVYCYRYGKLKLDKYLIISILLLFFIAIPLILFVAVNVGLISEIKTKFFSIPLLVEFRSDEFTVHQIFENIKAFFRIYIKQYDDNLMNAIPYFGLFYVFSFPFMLFGVYKCIKKILYSVKKKKFCYEFMLGVWIVLGVVIGLTRTMSIYRANYLNLAIIIVIVIGIYEFVELNKKEWFKNILVLLFTFSFTAFMTYYFTNYQEQIIKIQMAGTDKALEYALSIKGNEDKQIRLTSQIRHSQVLFYTSYPVSEFMESVVWENYPAKWVYADKFGDFSWDIDTLTNDIYILATDEIDRFEHAGYKIKFFDACAVAVCGD